MASEHTPRSLERLFELYGGAEQCFAAIDRRIVEFESAWAQDTERIGRVLRSHLVVEHFLSTHLANSCPGLGSIGRARLTFAQKIELLSDVDPVVAPLKPGLRHLNQVRNRLSHKLSVLIKPEDRAAFLGVELFRSMRDMRKRVFPQLGDQPLDVLEDFSRFAAGLFQARSSPDSKLWQLAFEAEAEPPK